MAKKRQAEKNSAKPKIKKPKSKKGLFNSSLFKLAAVAAVIGCGAVIFDTESDCSEKEQELTRIQADIDSYTLKNEELQRTLESDDISAYMERIALEEYYYAYPDERRFYDESRD